MSFTTLIGFQQLKQAFESLEAKFGVLDSGVVVGTNTRYAPHQEFGTKYQSGTPHVRPAVNSFTKGELESLAEQADDADELLLLVGLNLEERIKRRAPVDTGTLRASYRTETL